MIRALPTRHQDGVATRTGELRHGSADVVHASFAHPDQAEQATSAVRPLLLALLPAAMRLGRPVAVEGAIDQATLDGLMEWQEAMARWHPGVVAVVPLRVEVAPPAPAAAPTPRRGLVAFSGGLDSCFSAVRHRAGAPEPGEGTRYRRTRLATGVMVHGFDIALDQPEVFASAYERSRRMIEALDAEAAWVRTDVRAQLEHRFALDWETLTHGIWLVAALSCFEEGHRELLVPSSFAYDLQQLPWGSNPMTDPLLGSGSAAVWHDGSGVDRPGKAEAVAQVPAVLEGLRVCWQGDLLDRNCGHCSKCLLTQACFWAVGVDHLPCFHDPGTTAELVGVDLHHPHQRLLSRAIQERADAIGRRDIVDALERALTQA